MRPGLRKLALMAHVTASVGWLGAVIVFLMLSVLGVTSHDPQTVRGAHVVMEPIGWFVLVPLSLASLLTGVVQSLGTDWGVFRHYWVVFKLAINLLATIVLLLYMQTLAYLADVAEPASSSADVRELRTLSPVLHAGAAVLLLLVATTLAVYKPRGVTWYGRRKLQERRTLLVP